MSSKPLFVALFIPIAFTVVFGQDPTKAESSHYKLAFENESVQVVDVHYGPHEKSGMHDHPGGVVVVITGGHLRLTDQHGRVQEVFAKSGESRWFPPFKHKVENLGDSPYNAVYIGIKGKHSAACDSANHQPQIDVDKAKILAALSSTTR